MISIETDEASSGSISRRFVYCFLPGLTSCLEAANHALSVWTPDETVRHKAGNADGQLPCFHSPQYVQSKQELFQIVVKIVSEGIIIIN